MAKKKITAYTRERNRVVRTISRLKKKGINVDIYFPTEKEIRESGAKGKEITKLVRELKAYTSEELKKYETKPKKPSLEDIARYGRQKDRYEYFSGSISNEIIGYLETELSHYKPEIRDKIMALINTAKQEQGEEDVAIAIRKMPDKFFGYLEMAGYDSESAVDNFSSAFINFLPNASKEYKENLSDLFEYDELGYTIEN